MRGGALLAGHFEPSTLAGDRIVTDTHSGLIWQGCPEGVVDDPLRLPVRRDAVNFEFGTTVAPAKADAMGCMRCVRDP